MGKPSRHSGETLSVKDAIEKLVYDLLEQTYPDGK